MLALKCQVPSPFARYKKWNGIAIFWRYLKVSHSNSNDSVWWMLFFKRKRKSSRRTALKTFMMGRQSRGWDSKPSAEHTKVSLIDWNERYNLFQELPLWIIHGWQCRATLALKAGRKRNHEKHCTAWHLMRLKMCIAGYVNIVWNAPSSSHSPLVNDHWGSCFFPACLRAAGHHRSLQWSARAQVVEKGSDLDPPITDHCPADVSCITRWRLGPTDHWSMAT